MKELRVLLTYKGYSIHVKPIGKGKFRAVASSGDECVDDTREEAIEGIKRKIDNISIFHEMQEGSRSNQKAD